MKVKSVTQSAPLVVRPLGDRLYMLPHNFSVTIRTDEGAFAFKFIAGFVTNFRSGGVAVDLFIDQVGDEKKALCYLVHDAMYTPCAALGMEHPVSRKKADTLLREALNHCGMGSFKAALVYNSVRAFGESAYEEDDKLTLENSRMFTFEWRDK